MAGKTRVHELAKELWVPARDVLAWLTEHGETVRSASSTIPAPVARRLRESRHTRHTRHTRLQPNADDDDLVEDPPHKYLRDGASPIIHHCNYFDEKNENHHIALCGHEVTGAETVGFNQEISDACPACRARLFEYYAWWWRNRYQTARSQLQALQVNFAELKAHSENQRTKLSQLQNRARSAKRAQTPPSVQNAQQRSLARPHERSVTGTRNQKGAKQPSKPGSLELAKPRKDTKPLASPFARRLGVPVVTREQIAEREAAARSRAASPENAHNKATKLPRRQRQRPKSPAERASDDAAAESMRSYKPSSSRIGKSPSRYG